MRPPSTGTQALRPALIPIRLHCRRCLSAVLFCPRCGAELLAKGPASHVATNHLVRRGCGECGATFGVLLDGYEEDASSFSACPSSAPAPAEAEPMAAPRAHIEAKPPLGVTGDRQQLSLPVVLAPEPAPLVRSAATAEPATSQVAPPRTPQRRALALRLWWQIGHPAARRDGSTIAAAYRAIYGIPAPKKQGINVYLAAELDAIEEYLAAEQWTEKVN